MSDCCSNSSSTDTLEKAVPIKDMVCYCFQHTGKEIKADFIKHNKSLIEINVRQKVKENLCSCKILNPKGKCCLGDIRKVIKGIEIED